MTKNHTAYGTKQAQVLTESDLNWLRRSYITPELAAEARLFRVDDIEGARLVGRKTKFGINHAGIVFPYYDPGAAQPKEYRVRRDQPDLELQADGTMKERGKYLSPPGRSGLVYFPPGTTEADILDADVAAVIVEGEKKALSLTRYFRDRAERRLIVGLPGVWNFRGTVGKTTDADGDTQTVKGVVHDVERVNWSGRKAWILFDANASKNPSVRKARSELARELRDRGAVVSYLNLPNVPGVNGVDDFLAHPDHGPAALAELFEEEREDAGEYFFKNGETWWHFNTKEGTFPRKLATFTARIIRQTIRDDGGPEEKIIFEVEARKGPKIKVLKVPAQDFNTMNWPLRLDATARVLAGVPNGEKRMAEAVTFLSGDIPEKTIYEHTGWRKIGDRWAFLHATGAIGAEGVEIELAGLESYSLPEPPDIEAARFAVRRSLAFLDLAPLEQTLPLWAAMYAAPLEPFVRHDFVLWIYGQSGSMKSTATALALCHFGKFDRMNFPANFTSTGNQIERVAYTVKDAAFVVDDYAPPPDAKGAKAQELAAHRLIRAVGDKRGRGRMRQDASLNQTFFPRGLVIATSELDTPGAHSSVARSFQVSWRRNSMNVEALTHAQREDAPLYAAAMSGYIAFLAAQYDRLNVTIPAWLRDEAAGSFPAEHGRLADAAGKLLAGVMKFHEYAEHIGALTRQEAKNHYREAVRVLLRHVEANNVTQIERKPVALFFEALETLFAQGRIFLRDKTTGDAPPQPTRWGWLAATSAHPTTIRPNATLGGWIEEHEEKEDAFWLYLIPGSIMTALNTHFEQLGERFPLNRNMLAEHLEGDKLLVRESERQVTRKIMVDGVICPRVWKILCEKSPVADSIFEKSDGL